MTPHPEPPHPDLPRRPSPPATIGQAAARWLRWFGIGRLLTGAVSVVAMCVGAFLLLRSPTPPADAALPVATPSATADATLPPPSTVLGPASTTPSGTEPAVTEIVVHVAGAVQSPGVYGLVSTARVDDAVDAAGGIAPNGDPDSVNLAAPLVDGQRIYVPRVGEVDPASLPSVVSPAAVTPPVGSAAPSRPVDLNTATVDDLESLPGVGPATAAAIIDDRTRNGPFASVDDLDRVPGIGPAKLAALSDLVTT